MFSIRVFEKQLILLAVLGVGLAFVEAQDPPNHLKPIPPYSQDGYDQAVYHALLQNESFAIWMICRPSFSPERALLLRMETPPSADPFFPNRGASSSQKPQNTWTLETASATQQIWNWKDTVKDGKWTTKLDLRKDVKVNRKQVVINEPFAETLNEAWTAVLQLTRYPEEDSGGLDGVTYQFGVGTNRCGETWNPEKGLPAEIVALALKLEKFVQAGEKQQAAMKEECLADAKRLIKAAEAEAGKMKFKKE